MPTRKLNGEPFFFYFSVVILILVIGGFGSNAMVNFEDLPPLLPIVYIHGIIMLIWYTLVVVQTSLIRSGNRSLHMILGKTSSVLALGIIFTGILMTLNTYERSARVDIVTINIFLIINFIILYSLAFYRRKYSDKHKRLILFASLSMILPALGRITQAFSINDFISIPLLLVLMLAIVVYDLRTLKKVHKTTILGIVLIIVGIAFTIGLMDSKRWAQLLESTIG
jgi:hypothetical protein